METGQMHVQEFGPPAEAAVRRRPRLSRGHLAALALVSAASGAVIVLLLAQLVAASRGVSQASLSPLVGHPAPDFTIHTWTWDGSPTQTVHLAALKGHPVVVNFWASWCDACREEQPALQAAWQQYRARGVVFVGVAFQDTQQAGTDFLRQYRVTFPAGPDDRAGSIAIAYGLTGVPETVFIDRRGVVVSKVIGAVDDGALDRGIQALLH